MIPKAISYFSSLVVSLAMLAGSILNGTPVQAQTQPQPPAPTQPAPGQSVQSAPTRRTPLLRRLALKNWPYKGDPQVRQGLVLATVSVTGLHPVDVWNGLADGKSLADLATTKGKTAEDILAVFDESAQFLLDRAVQKGRLPEALAQSRIAWYEEAARQMVSQPGLAPAYPGLHELHVTLITAAVKVGGVERSQVRSELMACQTLNQVLSARGHTGSEAVEAAMTQINTWLDRLVGVGKLSSAQRQSWGTAIGAALNKMVDTPGLHVAGKECSH